MNKVLDKEGTCRKIKALCAEKNISVSVVTERLDVSPQTVYSWMSGRKMPSVDHMVELSALFEISLDEFIVTKDYPV